MTEEQVTKALLLWLTENGWSIVCYDFPQSGTGRFLHPNGTTEKNKDAINPDIVAVKEKYCVFFENKNRFYFPDFQKIQALRTTADYSDAIRDLLAGYEVEKIRYGIGYPAVSHKRKAKESLHMVDFVMGIREDKTVEILYDSEDIF